MVSPWPLHSQLRLLWATQRYLRESVGKPTQSAELTTAGMHTLKLSSSMKKEAPWTGGTARAGLWSSSRPGWNDRELLSFPLSPFPQSFPGLFFSTCPSHIHLSVLTHFYPWSSVKMTLHTPSMSLFSQDAHSISSFNKSLCLSLTMSPDDSGETR